MCLTAIMVATDVPFAGRRAPSARRACVPTHRLSAISFHQRYKRTGASSGRIVLSGGIFSAWHQTIHGTRVEQAAFAWRAVTRRSLLRRAFWARVILARRVQELSATRHLSVRSKHLARHVRATISSRLVTSLPAISGRDSGLIRGSDAPRVHFWAFDTSRNAHHHGTLLKLPYAATFALTELLPRMDLIRLSTITPPTAFYSLHPFVIQTTPARITCVTFSCYWRHTPPVCRHCLPVVRACVRQLPRRRLLWDSLRLTGTTCSA